METLSNLIFDIKEKITDNEYKTIMETLGECKNETNDCYEISYIIPEVSVNEVNTTTISTSSGKRIVKLEPGDYATINASISDRGFAFFKFDWAQMHSRQIVEIDNTNDVCGGYDEYEYKPLTIINEGYIHIFKIEKIK